MVPVSAEHDDCADRIDSMSQKLVAVCRQRALTIAVAESLTGGLVSDAIVRTTGASKVFRGGVIAYVNDVKVSVLGVSQELLNQTGAVTAEVAQQMAIGAAEKLGADIGLATTGVAGPGAQGGIAPGTVFIAAALPDGRSPAEQLDLAGTRTEVRCGCVFHTLELALRVV